ncbi:lysine-specific demethylase 5B-B-like [Pseudoliparis swirei]|uniref:lysine-specific demethylase 5B-B-like n=1 Tax=Pseudoliparis swirei TaxID=2059687 RepID=UPI0024BE5F7B|nr:lysine-specific demethylase 5B-B-like [Pseudoliparis swirei]XP_056289649.1 lysine-specific demethylase 5B-B-like [Pseudoliparis swirei]
MRRICHSKSDWVDIKWKGAVLQHPVQQDGNSCGLVVIMMANEVMEAFPIMPNMVFGTTIKEMEDQRKQFALKILKASVFESEDKCSMCSAKKPPGPGPAFTDWIQCDSCSRWFHSQCLGMDTQTVQEAANSNWNCCLCPELLYD